MAAPVADYTRIPDAHLAEHNIDSHSLQPGYVRATDYSLPYISPYSRLHPEEFAHLLRSLNCGYLSTPGIPPTLVALKQHAQALCNLILLLVPTVNTTGVIDADKIPQPGPDLKNFPPPTFRGEHAHLYVPTLPKYDPREAFDFLTDLSKPYTSDEPNHHLPLTALMNQVEEKSDVFGTHYHCPLKHDEYAKVPVPRAKGQAVRPYADHHGLVMHANNCLERLDHEYSTEGGLLAILPSDGAHDSADKKAARNTLLGQWLTFTQHLVRRQHELEISYGNALDVLAGDAVVPYATMGAVQPDGRDLGRQICFPQDKWVLANAGEDIWGYLHKVLDNQEVVLQAKEEQWKSQGVSGERMWLEDQGGRETAKGIVHVTIPTRFYRLAGSGHGTVFVVPGHGHHPGVSHTNLLERYPKIVGTPMATFPDRVTEMDKRVKEKEDAAEKTVEELEGAARRAREEMKAKEIYKNELERVSAERDALREAYGGDVDVVQELVRARAAVEAEKAKWAKEREAAWETITRMTAINDKLTARLQRKTGEVADEVADVEANGNGTFMMSGAL